jgi:hypothetical protein
VAGLGLPVFDERSAVAMVATSAQLGVKGVEHVGIRHHRWRSHHDWHMAELN